MDLRPEFAQACAELTRFRAAAAEAAALIDDPQVRARVDAFAKTLDQASADLEQSYPKALTDLDQRLADVQKQTAASLAEVAALEPQLAAIRAAEAEAAAAQEAAAAAAAGLPAPPAPPQPEPPLTGQQLRQELLERFGKLRPTSPPQPTVEWPDWLRQ